MSRRARAITATVLFAMAAVSIGLAASLVQVTGGSLMTGVYSRVPDWSTNALTLVIVLATVAVAAIVGGVVLLLRRGRATA